MNWRGGPKPCSSRRGRAFDQLAPFREMSGVMLHSLIQGNRLGAAHILQRTPPCPLKEDITEQVRLIPRIAPGLG